MRTRFRITPGKLIAGEQTPDLEKILKLNEVTENDHRQARVAVYIYVQQEEP
jgi:hypothetical protein